MARWYWHIHHEILAEVATEPISHRKEYIMANKPVEEIETRLRLLKPIKGKVPAALAAAALPKVMTWRAYGKADAAYVKAWAAYDKAWAAYNRARNEARPALEELHIIECPDCPWDGWTIFPEGAK